mmetsp:Transcript_11453/g.48869  ORF Transcript_11453/g.48869 Transcript_11453/m.48869 type:complete len:408 (+) Transcript_11453:1074-2297(+)
MRLRVRRVQSRNPANVAARRRRRRRGRRPRNGEGSRVRACASVFAHRGSADAEPALGRRKVGVGDFHLCRLRLRGGKRRPLPLLLQIQTRRLHLGAERHHFARVVCRSHLLGERRDARASHLLRRFRVRSHLRRRLGGGAALHRRRRQAHLDVRQRLRVAHQPLSRRRGVAPHLLVALAPVQNGRLPLNLPAVFQVVAKLLTHLAPKRLDVARGVAVLALGGRARRGDGDGDTREAVPSRPCRARALPRRARRRGRGHQRGGRRGGEVAARRRDRGSRRRELVWHRRARDEDGRVDVSPLALLEHHGDHLGGVGELVSLGGEEPLAPAPLGALLGGPLERNAPPVVQTNASLLENFGEKNRAALFQRLALLLGVRVGVGVVGVRVGVGRAEPGRRRRHPKRFARRQG